MNADNVINAVAVYVINAIPFILFYLCIFHSHTLWTLKNCMGSTVFASILAGFMSINSYSCLATV